MRVVIAPNAFKECLSAAEAAEALAAGVRAARPDAEIDLAPVADGGEGTAEALARATGGRTIDAWARDPLGEVVQARYAILGDARTAAIDVAAASGLWRVPVERRHPGFTTSFGTGELMLHAIAQGVQRIIVGLGGSATNDAGAGMAQALGWGLRDADDRELPFGGFALARLDWIDPLKVREGIRHVDVVGACDVDNPLCGPNGASFVYGPQKGAEPRTCEMLDAALRRFGEYVEAEYGLRVIDAPCTGAAGGLGAGLMMFCNAELRSGFDVVADAIGLADRIRAADLVITGEGKLDSQSLRGKAPAGVAALAKGAGVACWAVAGQVEIREMDSLRPAGFAGAVSLAELAGSVAGSLAAPARYLEAAARRIAAEACA
jgi:glycerate kinase